MCHDKALKVQQKLLGLFSSAFVAILSVACWRIEIKGQLQEFRRINVKAIGTTAVAMAHWRIRVGRILQQPFLHITMNVSKRLCTEKRIA